MTSVRHLLIDRKDLSSTRTENGTLAPLENGESLVRIDRVAMTANNVTYAAIAHLIPYFEFFPSGVDGFGRLPTWGFGDVVESMSDDLAVGTRLFGFWPSSTHLVMRPERQGRATVVDEAPHRQPLPPVYNSYTVTEFDTTYHADLEDLACAFRPLFMTAFSIDELFGAEHYMGASRIVLSSASSKTAWATAHLLSKRDGIEVIGLTSRSNVAFVEGLETYDRVVAYEEVAALEDESPTAYLDYAGSDGVRRTVRNALGSALVFDLSVGISHWSAVGAGEEWADPPITRFFAPSTIRDRMEAIGRDTYMTMYMAAWEGFVPAASGALEFEEHSGIGAMQEFYNETVAGLVQPNRGIIIRPAGLDGTDLSSEGA